MWTIPKPDFENMSDNKKFFIIWLWVFFVLFILFLIYISIASSNKNTKHIVKQSWDFTIWTVWEWQNFWSFIEKYKSKNKNISSLTINTVNFPDYESYYYALNSAFIKWQAPDIFVVNNNDWPIFEDKIEWINPNELSISDFWKYYPNVFLKDLTREATLDNWKTIKYIIWIPISYETLWILYNTNLLREISWNINQKITSWNWIDTVIEELEQNNSYFIPIWLWNSNTTFIWDIIANFLLQTWENYIWWQKTSQAISNFISYGLTKKSFIKSKKSDIELFKEWKLAMLIWYPRILFNLSWMSDSDYVKASYFPRYSATSNNNLINYNYYVINVDSKKKDLAKDILFYFATKAWVEDYYETTKNYHLFPALLSVDNIKNELVNPEFNIYLKDFENKKYILKSFDKKLKFFYDNAIKKVVDSWAYNYQIELQKFNKKINCLANKIIYLKNLWSNCE